MATLSEIINRVRDSEDTTTTNRILSSIDKMMKDDEFDVTKAVHKIERKVENRLKDIETETEVKRIQGTAKSSDQAENPFESNQVTKLYVDSLKDIVGNVHNMTREELRVSVDRMKNLMSQIGDATSESLKEKDFLEVQYGKSLKFLEKEYTRRSALSTRAVNKLTEVSEQYLDFQSIYSGLVDNNPVAMGLFRIGADMIGSYRKRKKMQKKAIEEDNRRQQYAMVLEQDREKDRKLESERSKKIDEARMQAAESQPQDVSETLQNEITSAFAGLSFPQDEFSDTGDAQLSAEDLQGIFDVTGGTSGEMFTRDYDAEMEAERQQAMAMMRGQPIPDNKPGEMDTAATEISQALQTTQQSTADAIVDGVEQLRVQNAVQFERMESRANEDERETDEYQAENTEHQQAVLERLDRIVDRLDGQTNAFEKMGSKDGGGLLGGLLGEAGEAILGAGLLKIGSKFMKPITSVMKLAAPVVAGGAALLSKVGLGKAGEKVTEKFTNMGAKVLGKDAAKGIAKEGAEKATEKVTAKGVEKVAKKGAAGQVAKTGAKSVAKKAVVETGAKAVGKSLLKKIPGIGLLAGIGFGISRLLEGDVKGAGLEVLSGAASTIPGAGTAASIAIDSALIARDMGAFESGSEQAMGLENGAEEGQQMVKKAIEDQKREIVSEEGAQVQPIPGLNTPLPATPTPAEMAAAQPAPEYRPSRQFDRQSRYGAPPIHVRQRGSIASARQRDVDERRQRYTFGTEGRRQLMLGRSMNTMGDVYDFTAGHLTPGGYTGSQIAGTTSTTQGYRVERTGTPSEPFTRTSRPATPDYTGTAAQIQTYDPQGVYDASMDPAYALKTQIAEGEGTSRTKAIKKGFASEYDVPYAYGAYGMPEKPLSQMTVAEVKAFQKKQIRATRGTIPGTRQGTGAVGKYQVVGGTLKEQQKKLGFSDDELFTAELQEKIGTSLLEKRGYSKYKAGKISEDKFQNNLALEWASVARADTGRSAYGQGTGTSTSEIRQAMRASKMTPEQLTAQNKVPTQGQPVASTNQNVSTASTSLESAETPMTKQTVQLEQTSAEYNMAKEEQQKTNIDVAATTPPKTHSVARQGSASAGKESGQIASARNSDSTIQRLTDRWISHSFA